MCVWLQDMYVSVTWVWRFISQRDSQCEGVLGPLGTWPLKLLAINGTPSSLTGGGWAAWCMRWCMER